MSAFACKNFEPIFKARRSASKSLRIPFTNLKHRTFGKKLFTSILFNKKTKDVKKNKTKSFNQLNLHPFLGGIPSRTLASLRSCSNFTRGGTTKVAPLVKAQKMSPCRKCRMKEAKLTEKPYLQAVRELTYPTLGKGTSSECLGKRIC